MQDVHLPQLAPAIPQLATPRIAKLMLLLLLLEVFPLLPVGIVMLLPRRRLLVLLLLCVEARRLCSYHVHWRHREIEGLMELCSGHWRSCLAGRTAVLHFRL